VLPRGARISVRYTCSKNKARIFEIAIAHKTKRDPQFYTELAVHIAELRSLSQCNGDQRKKHEARYVSAVLCVEQRNIKSSL